MTVLFQDILPDHCTCSLDARAVCLALDPACLYVATGTGDGTIRIYDIIAKTSSLFAYSPHSGCEITGLQWWHSSRYLASSGRDWSIVLADLAPGKHSSSQIMCRIRVPGPVLSMHINPAPSPLLGENQAKDTSSSSIWPNALEITVLLRGEDKGPITLVTSHQSSSSSSLSGHPTIIQPSGEQVPSDCPPPSTITCLTYSQDGSWMVLGTSKGYLILQSVSSREQQRYWRCCNHTIRSITPHPCKPDQYLVNAADKSIRLISVALDNDDGEGGSLKDSGFTTLLRLTNPERTQFIDCALSPSGDYILAGTAQDSSHLLHIYETLYGELVRILSGPPDDGLVALTWAPQRPGLCISICSYGMLYFWDREPCQRYSALTPSFTEIEENLVYQEREDEFDVAVKKENESRVLQLQEEMIDVVESVDSPRPCILIQR